MPGLLDILLHNESGGRNIANTTSGTDSGQARGYFQITTGTWDDFGGRQYAPEPMQATYAQQAMIASKIPLKRWAPSTVQLMMASGKPVDPNKTLGENLSANGENILQTTGATSTSSAPAYTTLVAPPSSTAGDAFASLNGDVSYADTEQLVERPSRLADTLASSVDNSTPQRRSSEQIGYNDLYGVPEGGAGDSLPPSSLASQHSERQASPAISSEDGSLADLFTVKDFGLAGRMDPRTGAPALPRHRRQYG